ncbi:MAG TPA: response regulator transcription factor [Gemmatimonadaceae bacterium]|jgi:two-component system, OmpR family, KDP operon response regulator KdpE|nr:response regulator transcription factor [Gemmatimonadaceae bacterium]
MTTEAPPYTLVIIEDEIEITRAVGAALREQHLDIVEADGGRTGLEAIKASRPDIIILDLGLPDLDGLEVCQRIRALTDAPIVVLTARHTEADIVALLNAGADDYITKPFSTQELAARVAAQLRRAATPRHAPISINADGLSIDIRLRQVKRGPIMVRLTPIEWEILAVLVSDPGRVFTHQQLFTAVWKRAFGDARLYLRVHVTNLRRKVERDPAAPRLIITEPGVGYRFIADS